MPSVRWADLLDIALVAFVFYRLMLLIKGTRAVQILTGLAIVFAAFHFASRLHLLTLQWLLSNFLSSAILVIVVLFQGDIRRALAQVARNPLFFGGDEAGDAAVREEIAEAAVAMSARRIGGLIAIERKTGLRDYVDMGTIVDARVTRELILAIFTPASPLHDGALIVRKRRISAAGCFLPLTTSPLVGREVGTRHRAAIGLTEETDAVVVAVSEERGDLSLVVGGEMWRGLDAEGLRKALREVLDRDRVPAARTAAADEPVGAVER